ncbi:MAG: response regulator [Planctomycetes bacterium]|nr:response regulator [Planctomycetota bacterium]
MLAICGLLVAAGTVWLLLPSALLDRGEGGQGSRPHLPVVAMSGASRASNYLTLATKLGAVAALEKPFSPDEMLRTIAAVMQPPSASATPETQPV